MPWAVSILAISSPSVLLTNVCYRSGRLGDCCHCDKVHDLNGTVDKLENFISIVLESLYVGTNETLKAAGDRFVPW